MGEAMMIGGAFFSASLGSITGSLNDVEDTCSALDLAKKNLDNLNKQITSITSKEDFLQSEIETFKNTAVYHTVVLGALVQMHKDLCRKKKLKVVISCSIFTFALILALLFKYFNVFSNIWNFIVNKK